MKKFHLSDQASARLEEIAENTEQYWGIAQCDKYLDALDACFHDLVQSPSKGRPCGHIMEGLRSYPEGSHVIFYLIERNGIQIIDILHEKMDVASRIKGWTRH